MSDETTPEQTPLPGEQMLTEAPLLTEAPPAPEMPTAPGWSRAVINIQKSKAEVITKEATPAEFAEYQQRFGHDAVKVLRYLEESN